MDRYTKVDQKKPNIPINENEIRITSQGLVRNYINYATTLIKDNRGKEIVLKAMGQAINKTVAIAEIIKRNIPRLHQDTNISSVSITDVWEPNEEGLLPVEMTRMVSMISITLSTKELNKNSPGYQAPLYAERSKPQYNNYQRQQPRQAQQSYNEEPYGGNYHGNRGRGQGGGIRGRGGNRFSGYGNGGYGSNQGGDGYRNYHGDNGYGGNSYQGGRGYGNGNYRGGRGYGNYQGGGGEYGNYRGGGGEYGNYQGGGGEYGNYQGGGEYRNYQDNNGYSNRGRGSGRGRGGNAGYRGGGYMRGGGGGGGGGRGGGLNGRGGRGRMGGAE